MHDCNGAGHRTERLISTAGIDSGSGGQRKCFWLLLMLLSLGAFFLPFGWGVVETLAAAVVS